MKISFELDAEFREDQGKGASRRLRHLGKVPAILYGGKRDARALLVDHTKLAQLMDNERFYSTILALKVGSQQQAAVLKDVQRHPYKNQIMHIDFQRVLEDEKIKMRVPLHFKGGEASPGVKTDGGLIEHPLIHVQLECLPKDLVDFIEVDLSKMELNDSIHLSQLKLSPGVSLVELKHGKDLVVATCHVPRMVEEEVPVAEVPAGEVPATAIKPEGEAAAGAAAAPGKPGEAPKAGAAPAAGAKPEAAKPEAKKPEKK